MIRLSTNCQGVLAAFQKKNDALFLVCPGWHSVSSKHLPLGTPENSLSGCGARFSES